jgi:hypothetical protein
MRQLVSVTPSYVQLPIWFPFQNVSNFQLTYLILFLCLLLELIDSSCTSGISEKHRNHPLHVSLSPSMSTPPLSLVFYFLELLNILHAPVFVTDTLVYNIIYYPVDIVVSSNQISYFYSPPTIFTPWQVRNSFEMHF